MDAKKEAGIWKMAWSLLPFRGPLRNLSFSFAWSIPVIALLGFASSLLEGIGIGLLIPLLATMMGSVSEDTHNTIFLIFDPLLNLIESDRRVLILMLLMLFLIIFKGAVQIANLTFISWIDGKIGARLRSDMTRQALSVGYPFYFGHSPSRLVNVIDHEAWFATQATRMVSSMVASGAGVMVFSVLLIVIDWRLLILVFIGIAIVRLALSFINRSLERLSNDLTLSNRTLVDSIMSIVQNARLIRIFGQEDYEFQRFEKVSEDFRTRILQMDRLSGANGPVAEMLYAALFLVVMLSAIYAGNGVPATLAFLVLLYRMQPQLLGFIQARANLASYLGSVREVEWFLDPSGKPDIPEGSKPCEGINAPIVFSDVDYRYPDGEDDKTALTAVSFEIPHNAVTALIGRSGSGKSTIVNLLCRLLEPEAGRISVDGMDISEFDVSSWRHRIAIAGQDIELFDGTITENIAYGLKGATRADIEDAAQMADADEFIRKLPDGYDAVVGSRGINLSGGERQRIGMARALVRKPDFLILDEATNAVDGLSEKTIFGLLHDRRQLKAALVISHRQSTLTNCDIGIVIDNGTVVEAGPLRTLKYYKAMEAGV